MGPIYSLETICRYVNSFERLTVIEQLNDQPTVCETVFIGKRDDGGITALHEEKGIIEIENNPKTRFIYGGGHPQREVLERYFREMEMGRREGELSKIRKGRKHNLKREAEWFHEL